MRTMLLVVTMLFVVVGVSTSEPVKMKGFRASSSVIVAHKVSISNLKRKLVGTLVD